MNQINLYVGCDHAAYDFKNQLIQNFSQQSRYQLVDKGCYGPDRCAYPDYAFPVIKALATDTTGRGLLICGSGIGMSIVANRFSGIRAALCRSEEDARLARQHNNSNILCLGARQTSFELAVRIIETWLITDFEGGRHQDRLNLFDSLGTPL